MDNENKGSAYLLYEYNVSPTYVNLILRSGYSLSDLKQNPDILVNEIGEYKNNKLKKAIKAVDDINRESIYVLLGKGLSKNIADELFNKKITVEMLDKMGIKRLHEEYKFGTSTSRKIYEALSKYKNKDYSKDLIDNSKENFAVDYTNEIKKTLLEFEEKYIPLRELYENEKIQKLKLTEEQIYQTLEVLEKQERIIVYPNNIKIRLECLDDAIENYISTDIRKEVVREVLNGKKQIKIAAEKNLSRERVRQIFNKGINELPYYLEEDKLYKDIFTKFNFEEELFTKLFMTEKAVYHYLNYKYVKGENSVIELLDTDYFDENQENIIKEYYNLITYNDLIIKEDKMQLLLAILQTEGIQYNIIDLIDKYNKIIEEKKYNLEKIDNVHNIESNLIRQKNIIASNKRRYRFYNYNLLTQEDIQEVRELLNVDNGVYYTDYFFDRNYELMNKINIIDKNELYNLMKTLFPNEQNITFSNMPIVLIGYTTKEEFFLEKMNNLSPISVDSFIEKISNEYGFNINSLKSYITKEFYKYITKGMISFEAKNFNDEQIERLRKVLVKDIYSIKELKEILYNLFNMDCTEYIKTVNFEKLNYKIRDQYIYKTTQRTVDEIVKSEMLEDDIFNIKETRLKDIGSSFWWNFYGLIYQNKLIKYNEELYYTEKKLKEIGINNEVISSFKNDVYENIDDNQIFTLFNIKNLGICKKYPILNVNDVFVESIIKTIDGIKNVSVENNIVFLKSSTGIFNKSNFIEKIILDNELTKIADIQKFLVKEYNVNMELSQIKELISLSKYNIEDDEKQKIILEDENIDNASDDYNFIMVLNYLEKIFGIGIQRNFSDDKISEFLKRFDNTLNTLSLKEKKVVILKNGLKDGNKMTAEAVADNMEIVSSNAVSGIDRKVIEKLKNIERTKILRSYFNFSSNYEDSKSDFILNLLK